MSKNRKIFIVVALIMVVASACQAQPIGFTSTPTNPPLPSDNRSATPSSTPTPTPTPIPNAIGLDTQIAIVEREACLERNPIALCVPLPIKPAGEIEELGPTGQLAVFAYYVDAGSTFYYPVQGRVFVRRLVEKELCRGGPGIDCEITPVYELIGEDDKDLDGIQSVSFTWEINPGDEVRVVIESCPGQISSDDSSFTTNDILFVQSIDADNEFGDRLFITQVDLCIFLYHNTRIGNTGSYESALMRTDVLRKDDIPIYLFDSQAEAMSATMISEITPQPSSTSDVANLVLQNTATSDVSASSPLCPPGIMLEVDQANNSFGLVSFTKVSTNLTGENLTVIFNLLDLPNEITINKEGVGYYLEELTWGVAIDIDNDAETGRRGRLGNSSLKGYEYVLRASNSREGEEVTGTLESLFGSRTFVIDAISMEEIQAGSISVNTQENTITLSGLIPGITENSNLIFYTYFAGDSISYGTYSSQCR